MGVAHCSVTLEHKSGLPKDRVVNTFTFQTAGDFIDPADRDAIVADLTGFYEAAHAPAARSIGSFLSPALSRTVPPVVRMYNVAADLFGTPIGSPEWMVNLPNLPANVSANALPSEIAFALSFHADFGADVEFAPGARPRARDRGRVYIGPLALDAVETGAGPPPRAQPTPALSDAVVQAGVFLRTSATTDWVVWSRRNGTVKSVTSVSIDNAFDSQRRRGEAPSVKTVS